MVVAWVLTFLTRTPSGESRGSGADASMLGRRHYYGAEARSLARSAGISLPQEGTDCYYSIGGLKPVWEFIAVTLPGDKAWPWIRSVSGKSKVDAEAFGGL